MGQSTCGGGLGGDGSEHMWGRAEEGRGQSTCGGGLRRGGVRAHWGRCLAGFSMTTIKTMDKTYTMDNKI